MRVEEHAKRATADAASSSARSQAGLIRAKQEVEERLGLASAPRIGGALLRDNRRRWGRLGLAQLELVGEAVGARHDELAVVPGPLRQLVALALHLDRHDGVGLQIDDGRVLDLLGTFGTVDDA